MNVDSITLISTFVGMLGTLLAFIEIWKPNASGAFERYIDSIIEVAWAYRKAKNSILAQSGSRIEEVWEVLIKGPEIKSLNELKSDLLGSINGLKLHGLAYAAIFAYYGLLAPAKTVAQTLNHIGKGKAVGGIGIILNLIGLGLGLIAQ